MNGCIRGFDVKTMLKRLGVLSLRAVAVLLSDLRDQIGIGDNKKKI